MRPDIAYTRSRRLPTETLQLIFSYLSPKDFDSARFTCSSWHLASLDSHQLRMIAELAGWSQCLPRAKAMSDSEIEKISDLLHRECRLADLRSPQSDSPQETCQTEGSFHEAATVDLTHLGHESEAISEANSTFSIDTHFLLFFHGQIIYLYHLEPSQPESLLTPVASITCPRPVLRVCMDASAGRHGVAALLEGHIACISNLEDELVFKSCALSRWHTPEHLSVVQVDSTHQSVILYNASFERDFTHGAPRHSRRRIRAMAEEEGVGSCEEQGAAPMSSSEGNQSRTAACSERDGSCADDTSIESAGAQTYLPMSRCNAPLTLYTSIGSSEDPPRSMALCPSRRSCIAFGCNEGVQLHWLEGLQKRTTLSSVNNSSASSDYHANLAPSPAPSEPSRSSPSPSNASQAAANEPQRKHLMKWFPLSAPSECLRFVPKHPSDTQMQSHLPTDTSHLETTPTRQRLRLVSSVDIPTRLGGASSAHRSLNSDITRNGIWTRLTR